MIKNPDGSFRSSAFETGYRSNMNESNPFPLGSQQADWWRDGRAAKAEVARQEALNAKKKKKRSNRS